MDIRYIFKDEYHPKQRKDLLIKEYLRAGLKKFDGNRTKTSEFLGISIRSVRLLLNKHPDVKKEFPPTYTAVRGKGKKKPKVKKVNWAERNRTKSVLIFKYKIKGRTFDSIEDIAAQYDIPFEHALKWVEKRVNDDMDMVITVSYPRE